MPQKISLGGIGVAPAPSVYMGHRTIQSVQVSPAPAVSMGHHNEAAVGMDNQPISAGFFHEGRWLTDFITPDELEVTNLYNTITKGLTGDDRLIACWHWVANQVEYHPNIKATIEVMGKRSTQNDYWMPADLTIKTKVGNCAVNAILLTSLLRNALPQDQVYCVLGNLMTTDPPGGHAWVSLTLGGSEFVMEATRPDLVHPLIPAGSVNIYDPVHYFNDRETYSIAGKTVMNPITACYSSWLKDYLDWNYINGERR